MTLPRIVVTVDHLLDADRADALYREVAGWLKTGQGTLVLLEPLAHVAVEQPDGTWLRVCHDHATTVKVKP